MEVTVEMLREALASDQLEVWAKSFSRDEIVGRKLLSGNCPIAKHLQQKFTGQYGYISVDENKVIFATNNSTLQVDHSDTMRLLVHLVDSSEEQYITAADFLKYLKGANNASKREYT